MNDIVQRVEASLRMNAINGDGMERGVFESQIQELVKYARTLEDKIDNLEWENEKRDLGCDF